MAATAMIYSSAAARTIASMAKPAMTFFSAKREMTCSMVERARIRATRWGMIWCSTSREQRTICRDPKSAGQTAVIDDVRLKPVNDLEKLVSHIGIQFLGKPGREFGCPDEFDHIRDVFEPSNATSHPRG